VRGSGCGLRRRSWGACWRCSCSRAGVAAVGISYWRLKTTTEFRLRPGQAQLSNEVVGEITNLEHREMKGDKLWVLLKADRDIKYSDGHHQLENVTSKSTPSRATAPTRSAPARR
jgi:hypothetical protein